MKNILLYSLFAAAILMTVTPAQALTSMRHEKVLSVVESHPQPLCCSDGTDAPLQFGVNDYNLKVRVGAKVYDLEYQTALDYFPSSVVDGARVSVRLTRHQMFLQTSGGELPTIILHRHNVKKAVEAKISA
jgi:hypothetical protein